jgi:hypothetical protein
MELRLIIELKNQCFKTFKNNKFWIIFLAILDNFNSSWNKILPVQFTEIDKKTSISHML